MLTDLNQKFCIIHNENGCGWHFLDWSINYLGGKTEYFYLEDRKRLPLSVNPIDSFTAHGHMANLIYKMEDLELYNQLIKESDYPATIQTCTKRVLRDKVVKNKTATTGELMEEMMLEIVDSTIKYANRANELGFASMSIYWSKKHLLVPIYQPRQGIDFYTGEYIPVTEVNDSWQNTFFKDSEDKFDSHVWDRRERMALNLRLPYKQLVSDSLVKYCPEVQMFSTEDIWFNLEKIIPCKNDELLSKWRKVYHNWQKIHDTKLSEDYLIVLDAIVNGQQIDLRPYNLNFIKEALIQHGLIYRHNLNIKTWQLETFPDNTADLHKLLEPNFHYRDPDYCKLWID